MVLNGEQVWESNGVRARGEAGRGWMGRLNVRADMWLTWL